MNGRTPFYYSAVIVLLAVVVVGGLDRHGRSARIFGTAGALGDPRVEIALTATPQEAFRLWKQRGYKGRTVVFIGEQWKRIDPSQYFEAPLYRQYPLKLYNLAEKQEREYLSADNILYFADLSGIARQITAVLGKTGFSQLAVQAPQARNVKFRDGEIFMTHHGFPRTFTTAEHFRAGREPVLLYVNADYFRADEPEILLRQLMQSGLTTDCVILCSQTGDTSVSATERTKLERFAGLMRMQGRVLP
ncbi:hypothetical protein [Geobacter grbiciae]|uniref:hypothetical protein n=1 Tax=Geobacter grbiciae TaxID=155042 RepID=UPI001C0189C8|nr:hypothetical protein [Geobacter grbiciae]MBT1074220.1 hypothetical protein [Geobacter grbiciae]